MTTYFIQIKWRKLYLYAAPVLFSLFFFMYFFLCFISFLLVQCSFLHCILCMYLLPAFIFDCVLLDVFVARCVFFLFQNSKFAKDGEDRSISKRLKLFFEIRTKENQFLFLFYSFRNHLDEIEKLMMCTQLLFEYSKLNSNIANEKFRIALGIHFFFLLCTCNKVSLKHTRKKEIIRTKTSDFIQWFFFGRLYISAVWMHFL